MLVQLFLCHEVGAHKRLVGVLKYLQVDTDLDRK